MIIRYVVPVLGLLLLGFGVVHVVQGRHIWSQDKPPVEPPHTPFTQTVAGNGLIEPKTENIAIGSAVSGVVAEVIVHAGQNVRPDEPLFRLDDRNLQAELKVREAALDLARTDLDRLEHEPRAEQVPISEALVREAKARLDREEYERKRIEGLFGAGNATDEELQRQRLAYQVALAQHERAGSELALLTAGTWDRQLSMSRASVAEAQARVDQVRTELDRLVTKAPVDGRVLKVNVRGGEFVGAMPGEALIVLGDIDELHVRVDIDEHDIPRFRPGTKASAALRGAPAGQFPLTFVRVEPFVIPKRSLSGITTERVDTRVLQVIFRIDTKGEKVYVGQQLDVFIDAAPPETAVAAGG